MKITRYKKAQNRTSTSFKVYMLAFQDKNSVRDVDVPNEELIGNFHDDLEKIFYYGQNDFQPKQFPSVSVGDVIDYKGQYYEVDSIGFKPVTKEEFDKMTGNRASQRFMNLSKSKKTVKTSQYENTQEEDLKAFRHERVNSHMGEAVRSKLKDFSSVDVRRLNGIFTDFQDLSKQAIKEMDEWLLNGENNITIEEAEKRLSYYLARMGLK